VLVLVIDVTSLLFSSITASFLMDATLSPHNAELTLGTIAVPSEFETITTLRAQLARAENRLAQSQHLAQIGSWELDLQTQELWWSTEVYELFALNPDEFKPSFENFLKAIHHRDRDMVREAYFRSVAEREPFHLEHRVIMPDGTVRAVMKRCVTIYNAEGQPLRSVGTVEDVTSQRDAQHRLRLAASVFENTHEGVIIVDAAMNVVDINHAFMEISGYSREESVGQQAGFWRSDRHDISFYRNLWREVEQSGRWHGEIWNRHKSGVAFPTWLTISRVDDHDGNTTHYVGVFTDITTVQRSHERLQYAAHHDALTGLPNRMLLEERLGQATKRAQRRSRRFAVVFIDLDHFKAVNDNFGHPVGDALLQEVADRLCHAVRAGDTVARIGGDEFVVLFDDIPGADQAAIATQKLLKSLEPPVQLEPGEVNVSCSIGVSLFPEDGRDAATLMRNADTAMYRTKAHGRNGFSFYTAELTASALERSTLEKGLIHALAQHDFQLHYQPQISLRTGRICGVEALIRWDHPELGTIAPERFIPIAEASGLIIPIGAWVMQTACAQAQQWLEEGVTFGAMAVNISGQQINRGDLPALVRKSLADTGLPPERLELEMTETFIMTQSDAAVRQLEELRDLGVQLAIDDFGTGYSSLSHLKQLPVHKLKIDQSFVRAIPDCDDHRTISRAMLALADILDLRVIAEGVETQAQVDFLLQAGCDEAQGFFYAHPVDATETRHFMQSWPRMRSEARPHDTPVGAFSGNRV